MSDQLKNILIGLFVTTAIAITIAIILFLEPQVGDGKVTLSVRFTNISGVNIGTRVNIAGKPVGEVISIKEIPKARQQTADELDRVYFYELTLKVDSSVKVYNTDEIAIQTTGLLGEKTINIIPKSPKKGEVPLLIMDKIIYGDAVEPIQNALVQISNVAEILSKTFTTVDKWLCKNNDTLTSTVNSLCTTMQNLDVVSKDIAQGKGTVGKLVKSDDLYLRFASTMSKADTLMNDINHYGLLFQYNKHWQRIRTKRATLINALHTPNEFRNYFEKELDSITTSLERISMLLDRANESNKREEIMRSEPFKKDFYSLMKQTEDLLDTLKLYNEHLQVNP